MQTTARDPLDLDADEAITLAGGPGLLEARLEARDVPRGARTSSRGPTTSTLQPSSASSTSNATRNSSTAAMSFVPGSVRKTISPSTNV